MHFCSRHCRLRRDFVSAACSAVHFMPRVRPLNTRLQLSDGCRQRRLCSEPSGTTSSALTNYGKWREWLLLAAAVTAIKGQGPPTQIADSRHMHACFFSFFLPLPQHSRHGSGEQGERTCVAHCSLANNFLFWKEGQDIWNRRGHLDSVVIKSDCWWVLIENTQA